MDNYKGYDIVNEGGVFKIKKNAVVFGSCTTADKARGQIDILIAAKPK